MRIKTIIQRTTCCLVLIERFSLVSKVAFYLVLHCSGNPAIGLKSRPMRGKTKINRDLLVHVFASASSSFAWSFDWSTGLSICSVIG